MKINKRYIILSIFFAIIVFISLKHFIIGTSSATIDAVCPFGGLESVYTWIITGKFVPRIMISSVILLFALVITTIIFRKGFCGFVCPFGFVQEMMGIIGIKLGIEKKEFPKKIDINLRYLKYVILIIILIGTAYTGTLIFREYDPYVSFFHFGKGIIWDFDITEFSSHIISFLILIFVLIGSLFIERIWCRYLCPLGGALSFFSFFSPAKIKRNKTCNGCKVCDKVCPTKVDISNADSVKSYECISCMQCIRFCPNNSLEIVFGDKR